MQEYVVKAFRELYETENFAYSRMQRLRQEKRNN